MWIACLLALLIAGPAFAQGFDLRAGDAPLTGEALRERLTGRTVTFYDDGQSEYYPDGRYTYTYAGQGGTAYGYWRIDAEGAVCIDFVNGFARCDLYVRNAGRLVLLDAAGERFPARPE
ncbi:hypothetical protein [Pseudoponticoccus marisrubri]|uniref:Uncharacterized protein n=1 Tax=Pseudoponticoccus marisrubri TaxID=1685382 RepID=A0A0W7WFP4_9RHOB|nr:hypothetical protein [Pseudoponticoccus marisrubri]KUF09436.1 hypothetical protein AVJ23_17495 [Pseudoponticoccus marisrubri]